MIFDTQRLATDPDYWRECGAPEDATHTCGGLFYKKLNENVLMWTPWHSWVKSTSYQDGEISDDDLIPRPTPETASEEWDGEGARPPSGSRCLMSTDTSDWQSVTIRYISKDGVVAELENGLEAFLSVTRKPEFRPIRTKQERQRDELAKTLKEADKHRSIAWCEDIADAILSRYNLEPKP